MSPDDATVQHWLALAEKHLQCVQALSLALAMPGLPEASRATLQAMHDDYTGMYHRCLAWARRYSTVQ